MPNLYTCASAAIFLSGFVSRLRATGLSLKAGAATAAEFTSQTWTRNRLSLTVPSGQARRRRFRVQVCEVNSAAVAAPALSE
ncbi:MAG: hypothetical protein AAF652_07490, partial [Cyanobacteria bacterium P01_C01_bin.72]